MRGGVLALLLAACQPATQVSASAETVAETIAPAIVAVQTPVVEAVEAMLPPATAPVEPARFDPRVVNHIIRWEVGSPARYTQRYQGVICPPGASGPTWAIGYDGGHQTSATILADWAHRDDKHRLAETSGQTGAARCEAARAKLRDVRIPYAEAFDNFERVSLPVWERATRRTYPGVEDLGPLPAGALQGNTYNRGTSMLGSRAAEKRVIRDDCVPRRDIDCVAAQLRAQQRLWPDIKGLRDRRESEAQLAEAGR